MKIFFKMSLVLLFSFLIVACSKDNESVEPEQNIANTQYDFSERAAGDFDYYAAAKAIVGDLENGSMPKPPLKEEELTRFLELSNIRDEVNLEGANIVIGEILDAHAMGYDKYMDERMDIREFTKQTILTIAAEGPMPDIEDDEDFKNLPKLEKKMIRTSNAIAKNYADNGAKFQRGIVDGIFGAIAGGGVGAYIGASIGSIFGPAGATIGGWIGGIVGGVVGWIFGESK